MSKINLNNITGGYAAVDLLNENFDAIEAAFDNTLSRDGSTPNTWLANQDANHKRLLNLGDPIDDKDAANKEYVINAVVDATPIAFAKAAYYVDRFTGDGIEDTFTLTAAPGLGTNSQVYINGVYQNKNTYAVSGTTLTFTEAPPTGSDIEVVVVQPVAAEVNAASNITIADAGNYYSSGYVEGALQEVMARARQQVSVEDFGAVGDGVTDDTDAIQNCIDQAAIEGFTVHIPRGTYLVSSSLQFPTSTTLHSVEVSGEKQESSYEWNADKPSVIIKASAAMSAVFTARDGLTSTLSQYAKLNNVAVDGNGLADYGYINGGQDTVENCTFYNCAKSGIYLGTFTNSSLFNNVSCIANQEHGAVLDGDWSTVSIWNNCEFRGNTIGGVIVYKSIASHFTDCIFENNTGFGLQLYAVGIAAESQILNMMFTKCYFEQNNVTTGGGYQIIMSGDAGKYAANVIFDQPHIVSGTAGRLGVQISKGQNVTFRDPLFTGDDVTETGWFNIGSEAGNIRIDGVTDLQLSTYITFDGAGKDNVIFSGYKSVGTTGTYVTRPFQANVLTYQVNAPASATLTDVQVSGTVVTNLGQAAANVIIDLPLADTGFNFLAAVMTAQGSNYWRIRDPNGTGLIYLNGTAVSYVQNSPAVLGSAIRFTAVTGSAYSWIAEPVSGTWTGA